MPKKIDHAQRRRDVTDVTRQLIIQGGLEAATMREIAKEAGFANGALKHFFDSKDDIIQATYANSLERMGERVSESAEEVRGLKALRSMAFAAMPDDDEKRTAGRVLLAFWERAVTEESMKDTYRVHLDAWRESLAEYLAQAREDGGITGVASDEVMRNEIVLLKAGGKGVGLAAPDVFSFDAQRQLLEAFFARITRKGE